MEHLDDLLEADDVAQADVRVHRDEVVEVVPGLGRLQWKKKWKGIQSKVVNFAIRIDKVLVVCISIS